MINSILTAFDVLLMIEIDTGRQKWRTRATVVESVISKLTASPLVGHDRSELNHGQATRSRQQPACNNCPETVLQG